MTDTAKNATQGGDADVTGKRFSVLDDVQEKGQVWENLARKYGVTNPDPPWKVTLETTCDLLAADSCIKPYDQVEPGSCVIPSLDRRWEEDELSATLYQDVPYPENQLLALAHSMMSRGLFDEDELAKRMEEVGKRLNSC